MDGSALSRKYGPGECYSLLIRVDEKLSLRVGRLGIVLFLPGYYSYTGRARIGLDARIARHMKKRKVCRWHIDYLTSADGVQVLKVIVHNHDAEKECKINRLLSGLPSARIYAPGFGASDCKQDCGSHLVYFSQRPRIDLLQIAYSLVNMETACMNPTVRRLSDRNP